MTQRDGTSTKLTSTDDKGDQGDADDDGEDDADRQRQVDPPAADATFLRLVHGVHGLRLDLVPAQVGPFSGWCASPTSVAHVHRAAE